MSTVVVSDRDDLIRPPRTLQPRFIEENEELFNEPMSDYFEDAEFSSTTTSKLDFRPALVSPVYTPTLSSLSSEVTSDGEGDELALPAFEAEYTEQEEQQKDSGLSTPKTTQAAAPTPTGLDPLLRTSSDDASIESEPERHVDYLSHDWREEDIWTSWRYVVARKDRYSNGVRLENASWRTWAKNKYGLRTVSPETLNWLKDCDVTWLYGPLQTDFKTPKQKPPPPSGLSSTNSFLDRKSILKKKTASEAILQRSLSQHTLLKHAGAILQAQKAEHYSRGKPAFERATSDMGVPLARIPEYSFNNSSSAHCTPLESASSGLVSPSEKRHIHFNNEVVQCIAVEAKDYGEHDVDPSLFFLGEEYDNDYDEYGDDDYDHRNSYYNDDTADTESDEGVVMMKQVSSRSFPAGTTTSSTSVSYISSSRSTPRSSTSSESKTIAPLPPTTLKCRSDTPELPWSSGQDDTRSPSSKLSPTPSVETLRPPRPEANFLLDDDDDEQEPYWSAKNSRRHTYDSSHNRPWFVNPEDRQELEYSEGVEDDASKSGNLHLTPSGMFMPYEEGEEASYTGMFGRIVDTVNTARDIAHVIWNVGWRK
ncbi:protein phosphatase type 1 complex subunit Hex2/Reg1, putative [Talaromyces stipitatus ATCC 10500]|uniref:Protein phosphatase type 1 complex subunit Hex2/Reg1, putative n=1 Tax=Talaromyces stipitatus (strain ATCC 10500 / CBS 375.48 / QM 6759 / NRRL 1006) TaxID=441959 RepID=B8MG80_TALSN|nr:protein phosphatase type 1 complex subunit Hex2/Reg1, putative [Talaromyces stipitatus ATCC 10500]EED15947.1 protein phosphatase type 1 complex subunit Hex2/Reg1, putative [Talaromyces stipitatus ATCC 10500]